MQVYRGFDIGTDKIPLEERENIPHHLLGIVDPTVQFTAADFVKHALKAIEEIQKRGNLSIITGGTGLYLKALLDGLFPEGEKNPYIRKKLEQEVQDKGLELLQKTQVVLKEEPNIVDSVLEHGHSFYAQAERESGDDLRVVIHETIDRGIHHSGAKYLQPPCVTAQTTPFSFAQHASNIHLGAGFCERKEAGPESQCRVPTENPLNKSG